jgi:hypothetical protein
MMSTLSSLLRLAMTSTCCCPSSSPPPAATLSQLSSSSMSPASRGHCHCPTPPPRRKQSSILSISASELSGAAECSRHSGVAPHLDPLVSVALLLPPSSPPSTSRGSPIFSSRHGRPCRCRPLLLSSTTDCPRTASAAPASHRPPWVSTACHGRVSDSTRCAGRRTSSQPAL